MSFLFILILLTAAFLFILIKRRKACIATLVFTFIVFLGIGNGLIPAMLLKQLQKPFVNMPEPQWQKQNAIILLGAGAIKLPASKIIQPTIMAYGRINEAARLYFLCKKAHKNCVMIISGGDAQNVGRPEANVYKDVLLGLGLNNADIRLESNSMNTYKNAEFTSALLNNYHFDQTILVTSGIHLKRALLYFSYFGIHANPVSADYLAPQLSVTPLGYNFALTDFAIHEYMGIFRFQMNNLFGWNERAASAGSP